MRASRLREREHRPALPDAGVDGVDDERLGAHEDAPAAEGWQWPLADTDRLGWTGAVT